MAATTDEPEQETSEQPPRVSRRERKRDQQAELRRLSALRQVRQYPDAVLRQPATPVTEFSDDLRNVVERMLRLMRDADGVGLAGNQVGLLRRLFVYRPAGEGEGVAVINPEIVERSDETESGSEGCLSLQGVDVNVERSLRVVVNARDEHGEPVTIEAEGFDARILQHEIDHLDGVLIFDRAPAAERTQALATLRPDPGPRGRE